MPRLQRDLTVRGDLTVGRGGSVRRPATTHSFPFAGELQGALADGSAEGLVGGEGVEPFGLRFGPGRAGSEADSAPHAPLATRASTAGRSTISPVDSFPSLKLLSRYTKQ